MNKKDLLGKWISFDDITTVEIENLKPGDYIVLRVEYDSLKFDYKLAYINSIINGQVKFDILDKNISRISKITDFCILPNYISNNFYKNYKQ